jgi:hypothetical protein
LTTPTRHDQAATHLAAIRVSLRAALAETDCLADALRADRIRYANLLAAARATLAADADAEPDPLYYLRDELANEHEDER